MSQMRRLDVIKATQVALVYFRKLYRAGINRLRVEEVELTSEGRHWLITLGYDVPGTVGVTFAETLAGKKPMPLREYKELKIDAFTGEVKYMKIRKT
jgi:hypothetical protein